MRSFSQFLDIAIMAYAVYQLVLFVWLVIVLRVWLRGPYPKTPPVLDCHPVWWMSPSELRQSGRGPRPADFAKGIFLTVCPIVNIAFTGSMLFMLMVIQIKRLLLGVLKLVSRLATGDANRLTDWFFRPIRRD